MKRWHPARLMFFCLFILFFCPLRGLPADDGAIEGVIKIIAGNDEFVYGEWIRVLLVKEPVEVPQIHAKPDQEESQRIDSVINAHLAFYKHVMEKAQDPSYIIASTLTRPDGSFQFSGLPPGTYHIVVAFPSIIDGKKVAWQVPVAAAAGKTERVELTDANLILPTYCRD